MRSPTSLSESVVHRHQVAKRPSVLKRQHSMRNLYKTEEKAANHDAMVKKFNLRKMSSSLGLPSKFGRASEIVIDKAIGSKLQRNRRFSLRRSVRSLTSVKSRQNALRALTSPIVPTSWTSTCHGIVMLVVYHFQLIYLPFSVSYYPTGTLDTAAIAMLLELTFLLDLLLNFNTAYLDQGVLVTSRRKIAHNYFRSWFAFDLLSAIPIQTIYCIFTKRWTHHNALRGVQSALMVLRLLRVALFERDVLVNRITRVARHVIEWANYSRYSHLLGIAQLMWLVLLIAHYMACFWHVIACKQHILAGHTLGEQYIADYYYAVSLIQGQGNASGTIEENLYSSVAIIVGSVVLAIVFGNVAMLVSNFNANSTNYHRKMEAVYETMDKMDLPLRLRERVNEYYKHVWLEYESLDGNINKFQQELTHTLGIEIGLYKHMNLVVKVPFWKECTPDFLTQIVLNLGVRVYMPDDYVVRRRETGSEMMMINRGYCKLSKPSTVQDEHSLMQHFALNEGSGSDSSDDLSSNDEELDIFGGGMFGASMDSSRWSGNAASVRNGIISDFTDVRRFRTAHPRRPSYPEGAGPTKSKRYREYLHPGQVFGEMSLLLNYKRTANIRAVTFVEMCVLSRKDFQHIISLYPEDRRRVLTSMLESCIDKKVIRFPWENMVEAVTAKRRHSGEKDTSRASVRAIMTAQEAARILVEAIDINVPDESIKYGFQNCEPGFIADSSLRHANSTDATISDTLHRRSSIRLSRSYSSRSSRYENSEENTTDLPLEAVSASSDGEQAHDTMPSVLLLVQSMADNISRLQQDLSELKNQACGHCCTCGGASANPIHNQRAAALARHRVEPKISPNKEESQAQTSRKPSFVVIPRPSASTSPTKNNRSGDTKNPIAALRKLRSKTQDSQADPDLPAQAVSLNREEVVTTTTDVEKLVACAEPPPYADGDRYPANLSSRSRAARNQTLADVLWKRSNTSGDMLKHTDEERQAARLRRQIRTRHSLPTEMTANHSLPGAEGFSERHELNPDPDPEIVPRDSSRR
ncbi:hypothetical protein PHYPSEUDO_006756 [Phytophthora pseudosyringae]|uniref:Cyclic nucleotide-binding domain-containing protein n=1 Tax=Phytophthora pseudosyringae TaxID=221518 RepID=A0A8T1VL78_9STRA|nr:hypothetical protein PHYPSEUDO_006756 [Phytophthora pseudosyringae]